MTVIGHIAVDVVGKAVGLTAGNAVQAIRRGVIVVGKRCRAQALAQDIAVTGVGDVIGAPAPRPKGGDEAAQAIIAEGAVELAKYRVGNGSGITGKVISQGRVQINGGAFLHG